MHRPLDLQRNSLGSFVQQSPSSGVLPAQGLRLPDLSGMGHPLASWKAQVPNSAHSAP